MSLYIYWQSICLLLKHMSCIYLSTIYLSIYPAIHLQSTASESISKWGCNDINQTHNLENLTPSLRPRHSVPHLRVVDVPLSCPAPAELVPFNQGGVACQKSCHDWRACIQGFLGDVYMWDLVIYCMFAISRSVVHECFGMRPSW